VPSEIQSLVKEHHQHHHHHKMHHANHADKHQAKIDKILSIKNKLESHINELNDIRLGAKIGDSLIKVDSPMDHMKRQHDLYGLISSFLQI